MAVADVFFLEKEVSREKNEMLTPGKKIGRAKSEKCKKVTVND